MNQEARGRGANGADRPDRPDGANGQKGLNGLNELDGPDPEASLRLPALPWPAQRLEVDGLRLALYDSGRADKVSPAQRPFDEVPLLLVHSVNAAASAFEWSPFALRQARRRRVVALELPGFGQSDKPDIAYSPAQMCKAVQAAMQWISASEIDIAALSLGCEFATEAVLAQARGVRSLALVSPTGMEGRRIGEKFEAGATRQLRWLRRLLRGSAVGRWLYRALTLRAVMHLFLSRSWGTRDYDPDLLVHARKCAAQPGARHAPLDFVAGALFTVGIVERYRALPVPVWVAHGNRGAFTDFDACPERTGTAAAGNTFRLQREVFDGGSMSHDESANAFDAANLRFLSGLAPTAFRWRDPRQTTTTTAPWPPPMPRTPAHEL